MAQGAMVVKNFREMQRAFALAEENVRVGVKDELKQIAEPTSGTAESKALSEIDNMPRSKPWSEMRVGVTRRAVYVAPRKRGIKTRGYHPRRRGAGFVKRRDFGTQMMEKSLEPALEQHGPQIQRDIERFLDTVADKFNTDI